MKFSEYINNVAFVINNMVELSRNLLNNLLNDNIFKSIIYILILIIVFEIASNIINLIETFVKIKKDKEFKKEKENWKRKNIE